MTARTDALATQVLPVEPADLDIDDATWAALERRFNGIVHPALRRVLSDHTFIDRFPFQTWLPASWQRLSEFSPGRVETPDFVIIGEKHDKHVPTGTVYGVEWTSLVDPCRTAVDVDRGRRSEGDGRAPARAPSRGERHGATLAATTMRASR